MHFIAAFFFYFCLSFSTQLQAEMILDSPWEYAWDSAPGSSTYADITKPTRPWQKTSFPCLDTPSGAHSLILKTSLPQKYYIEPSLYFMPRHHLLPIVPPFQVYVGGSLISAVSQEEMQQNHGLLRFRSHFLPLPFNFQNKELLLKVHAGPGRSGVCHPIRIGDHSDHLISIVDKNIPGIAVATLCFLMAVFGMVVAVALRKKEPFLSFIFLMLSYSIFIVDHENNLLKLILLDEPFFWLSVDIVAALGPAIFAVGYWVHLFPNSLHFPARYCWHFHKVATVLFPTLMYFNIASVNEITWWYSYLLIAFVFSITIDLILYTRNHDGESKIVAAGIAALGFFAARDVPVFSMVFPAARKILYGGILIAIACFTFILIRRVTVMQMQQRSNRQRHAKAIAIARTTQELAHEIKTPLLTLKSGLETIKDEENPAKVVSISHDLTEEVQSELHHVEGMLKDILELSSESSPSTVAVSPIDLLRPSMQSVFIEHKRWQIPVEYRFNHTLDVQVDVSRIERALTHLLACVYQAAESSGKIYLYTANHYENSGKQHVLFRLHNGKDFVPEDHIEILFDEFLSLGQDAKSGLGLIIAKKAITSHGGKIWCLSSKENGSEFYFTLPAA